MPSRELGRSDVMVAGVILLLVLINPDRTLSTMARPMPSAAVCEAAAREFVHGASTGSGTSALPLGPEHNVRASICVSVPLPGRDA